MTPPRVRDVVIAMVVGVIGTGCFGYYQPISSNLAGRRIQLSLTDSGAVILAPRLGSGIESIDGTLAADSAGRYVVSVLGTKRRDGQESDWRGEPVAIPRSLVSAVAERRFSRARTALFVTATSIALAATKRAFRGDGGATLPGNSPSGPPSGK